MQKENSERSSKRQPRNAKSRGQWGKRLKSPRPDREGVGGGPFSDVIHHPSFRGPRGQRAWAQGWETEAKAMEWWRADLSGHVL